MRKALFLCLALGIALSSVAWSSGPRDVAVVGWTFDSMGLLVELGEELEAGTLLLTVCVTLEDGSQVLTGIDASTNGHDQGRQSSGSGTTVIATGDDIDTSQPEVDAVDIVGVCSVKASFTPAK